MMKKIKDFFNDLVSDGSFFVFLIGVTMIIVVGILDASYQDKYNKMKIERYFLEREVGSLEKENENQKDTIRKQRFLIDLLIQLEEDKKLKIYAKL